MTKLVSNLSYIRAALLLMNKAHDAKGRFASGGSSASTWKQFPGGGSGPGPNGGPGGPHPIEYEKKKGGGARILNPNAVTSPRLHMRVSEDGGHGTTYRIAHYGNTKEYARPTIAYESRVKGGIKVARAKGIAAFKKLKKIHPDITMEGDVESGMGGRGTGKLLIDTYTGGRNGQGILSY